MRLFNRFVVVALIFVFQKLARDFDESFLITTRFIFDHEEKLIFFHALLFVFRFDDTSRHKEKINKIEKDSLLRNSKNNIDKFLTGEKRIHRAKNERISQSLVKTPAVNKRHLKQDEREGKGRAGGSYCRVFSTIPTIDEISFEYTYCRGGARGHSTFAAVINGVEFRWKTPLFDYSSTVEKEKPQRSCRVAEMISSANGKGMTVGR